MRRRRGRFLRRCAVGACILVAAGCHEDVGVPPELLGLWTSNNPDYRGRAMEFLEAAVVFHSMGDTFSVHPISEFGIAREDGSSRTRFDMVYSDLGRPMQATLFYSDDGDLVFEHQRAVRWRRGASAHAVPLP